MAKTAPSRSRANPKARTAGSTRSAARSKPSTRKAPKSETRTKAPRSRTPGKLEAAARDIAHAQLGLAAQLVEAVGIRVIQARVDAPKQWDGLVKRGEQVRRDLEQAGEGLRRQMSERAASFDPRTTIESRIARARSMLSGLARRRAAA